MASSPMASSPVSSSAPEFKVVTVIELTYSAPLNETELAAQEQLIKESVVAGGMNSNQVKVTMTLASRRRSLLNVKYNCEIEYLGLNEEEANSVVAAGTDTLVGDLTAKLGDKVSIIVLTAPKKDQITNAPTASPIASNAIS